MGVFELGGVFSDDIWSVAIKKELGIQIVCFWLWMYSRLCRQTEHCVGGSGSENEWQASGSK